MTDLKKLTREEFLALFDPTVHGALEKASKAEGVSALVCYENQDFWSSHLGDRSALTIGPGCTFQEPPPRLGDVPSRFKYPTAIWEVAP